MKDRTTRGATLRTIVMCEHGESLLVQVVPWPGEPWAWHVALYRGAGEGLMGPQRRDMVLTAEGRLDVITRAPGVRDYRLAPACNMTTAERQIARSCAELLVAAHLAGVAAPNDRQVAG